MTAGELCKELDAAVSSLGGFIAAKQAAYLAQHGRYATLDWSHSIDPADGLVSQPDRLSVPPANDQDETWINFGYPVSEPRCNARIDEYQSSQGRGYFLTMRFTFGGEVYQKSVNSGPEPFDAPWSVFVNM